MNTVAVPCTIYNKTWDEIYGVYASFNSFYASTLYLSRASERCAALLLMQLMLTLMKLDVATLLTLSRCQFNKFSEIHSITAGYGSNTK